MNRIKKGDEVIVITGKSKKQRGKVLKVMMGKNRKPEFVLVEGAQLMKKHVKPDANRNTQGGIIEREAPIHISNVKLLNPQTGKGDRVYFKTLEDGRKVRVFKSNDEVVDI